MQVLVVDDDHSVRYVCSLALESAGHQVFQARDGEEALAIASQERPDIIVLDIRMPHLDGFGVLRGLRADEALRSIPVVVLSAAASVWEQRDGWEAGADAYVVKPFLPDALVGTVEWVSGMSFGERLRHRERILSFIAAQRVS